MHDVSSCDKYQYPKAGLRSTVGNRSDCSVTFLTADSGVPSSIPALSYTFVEIDHEIVSTTILLPSADSRIVVVSYK